MDSIAGAINLATPHALEAEQNIAVQLRSDLLQLIGEPNHRFRAQALDFSKWPLVVRPIIAGNKLHPVTGFGDAARQSFQVGLCAAASRITAADQSDLEVLCHPERSRGIPSH